MGHFEGSTPNIRPSICQTVLRTPYFFQIRPYFSREHLEVFQTAKFTHGSLFEGDLLKICSSRMGGLSEGGLFEEG